MAAWALALALPLLLASCRSTPLVDGNWTAKEAQALEEYNDNQLVSARTSAEEALIEDPNSLVGHYVLGAVLLENEGRHARAMRHLGRARELYERSFEVGDPSSPWELHRDTLYAIQTLAGEMEDFDYRLEILEYYDAIYDPDLTAQHAWPLMRMGEFDEARDAAQAAIDSGDRWQHQLGLNARCALEGLAMERGAWFEACTEALTYVEGVAAHDEELDPEHGTNIAVHAYNAAEAALGDLRFAEAEDYAGRGARRLAFTPANPWRMLVRIYTDQGRMSEAVSALYEMRRWQARQPPNLRDHDRARTDTVLATVLLVAGESEAGMRAIDRAIDYPDRTGLTSTGTDEALGAQAVIHRAMSRVARERMAEAAPSSSSFRERWGARAETWTDVSRDVEQIRNVAAQTDRLVETLRPYAHGGFTPLPVWLVPELIEVIGPGVFAAALAEAREADDERFAPYYTAYEAELEMARGHRRECLGLVDQARETLPAEEHLLRARVAAVGAQCARGDDAMAYLIEAMDEEPGVIRRFGLAIPARIEANVTGGAAEEIARAMRRSPRFDDGDGFVLQLDGNDQEVQMQLVSPHGALQAGGTTLRDEEESDDDFIARATRELHNAIFAMPLGLSSTDLNSLDGSVSFDRENARQEINDLLHGVMDSEPVGP